ncbi:DNA damage-regulated autophagy modulator protein 1 [Xenopus tropicalis]|uniref:DNA damage-regulated autophagy modulator protein 1 n=1 Tax=Xenopus tropicalis TaxID=8364 RepID=A0A8J0SH96_XENTR|nr:DNA damage-regulated autophagy modulator protein 1 [Xenopus tropicalis]
MATFFAENEKFAPYTSGLGDSPLANAVFTVMHIICAYVGGATMYARYTLLRQRRADKKRTGANITQLVLGLLAILAYVMENNFPVLVFREVHIAGVLAATVCASAYTLINTVISYRAPPEEDSRIKCHLRLAISLAVILIIDSLRVISEWLSTVIFYGFLATFGPDFKVFGLRIPKNMEEDWFYITASPAGDVEAN